MAKEVAEDGESHDESPVAGVQLGWGDIYLG